MVFALPTRVLILIMWLTHLKPPSVGANGIRPPYKSFDFNYVVNSFETTICRGEWYSPSLQRFLILIMWLTHLKPPSVEANGIRPPYKSFDFDYVVNSFETTICRGEWYSPSLQEF
ncbi:hypothetical protein [Okeania sp. KiyG1]|uniref:hypothetical protein n=1 Tax=Okeania sp. KiyG1 TaxID=2720165 RepID=UPI0019251439|nr:hypothetical protein [Okeania sp. KiyG1]